jgi:hypothetical protein
MQVQQIKAQHANIAARITIPAGELHAHDLMHRPNWDEHVKRVDVETGGGVAFVTDEFPDFVQHLGADAIVQVDR